MAAGPQAAWRTAGPRREGQPSCSGEVFQESRSPGDRHKKCVNLLPKRVNDPYVNHLGYSIKESTKVTAGESETVAAELEVQW